MRADDRHVRALTALVLVALATTSCKKPPPPAPVAPKEVTFKKVKLTVPGDSDITSTDVALEVHRPVRPENWPKMDSLGIAEESELTFNARVDKSQAHVVTPSGEFWYSPATSTKPDRNISAEMRIGRDVYLYVTCSAYAIGDVQASLEEWCFPIMRSIRPR